MAAAIKVEKLSKAYQLGEIGTGTISQDIERWFARVRGKEDPFLKIGEVNDRTSKGVSDIVWSLKDINFEIHQGDAVGIIGRNGAGKSTLLKILSRVTSPTTGKISGKGRIASLLEVGTGFHPELTGKENIYLNGAILGMRKKEIVGKFDEIVDFAGVERYINTPVKRYSSGMYVRLAFAVAAHLESEILIVDEVLAVGDAEFQQKCIGKMKDVRLKDGRTVLFVSHNMAAVKNLCTSGILIANGVINFSGSIKHCIENYISNNNSDILNNDLETLDKRSGNGKVIFSSFHIESTEGQVINEVLTGDNVMLVFKLKILDKTVKKIDIGFSFHNLYDEIQSYLYSAFQDKFYLPGEGNYVTIKCTIKEFPFSQGRIIVKGRIIADGIETDWPKEKLGIINILFGDFYSTGRTTDNISPFLIKAVWE